MNPQAPSSGVFRTRETRLGHFKAALDRAMRHPATDAAIMALIVVSVALFLVEAYDLVGPGLMPRVILVGNVLTGFFIVELSTRWYLAPSTKHHFQEYWLDWLAVIPPLRAARALRILRILRAARLLRLYRFGFLAQRFIAQTDHHHYETQLRNEIAHYRGKYADQIWLLPDLFRMLGNLLEDGRVSAQSRQHVTTALAYFVTPFELLPRELYGAEGYLDQVYLCMWAVAQLREELPNHVLHEAWEGEGDILEIVETELPQVREALGTDGPAQLERYLGLSAAA